MEEVWAEEFPARVNFKMGSAPPSKGKSTTWSALTCPTSENSYSSSRPTCPCRKSSEESSYSDETISSGTPRRRDGRLSPTPPSPPKKGRSSEASTGRVRVGRECRPGWPQRRTPVERQNRTASASTRKTITHKQNSKQNIVIETSSSKPLRSRLRQ